MAELILALDTPSVDDALALVDRLGDEADFYKVGLELFTAAGPEAVRALRRRGKRVFLDLKLHDIPNTVAGGVAAAANLDVDLLTVHASGGAAMVAEAVRAAEGRVRILAVTLLTSLDASVVGRLWHRPVHDLGAEVERLAVDAIEAGADGLVSSAHEVVRLRSRLGPAPLLVTPGIRLARGEAHDQARVATPGAAVSAGADVLVVGRAVTAAPDPTGALREVRRQMQLSS